MKGIFSSEQMIVPVHFGPVAIVSAYPSAVKSITILDMAEDTPQLLDSSANVFQVAKEVFIPTNFEIMAPVRTR